MNSFPKLSQKLVGKNIDLFKSYVESIILLYEIHCHLYMNKENAFLNTADYHWKIGEKLIHFSIFCLCSLHFSFPTLVPCSIHSYRHIKKNCSFWGKRKQSKLQILITSSSPDAAYLSDSVAWPALLKNHLGKTCIQKNCQRAKSKKESIRNQKAFVLRNKHNLLKININMTFCSTYQEHIILHQ